jgi:hypothetical protein
MKVCYGEIVMLILMPDIYFQEFHSVELSVDTCVPKFQSERG